MDRNVGKKWKSPPSETSEKTIDMAESGQGSLSQKEVRKEGDLVVAKPIIPIQEHVNGSSDKDDKDVDDLIPQWVIKPHGSDLLIACHLIMAP